jgi:hypothetical protein
MVLQILAVVAVVYLLAQEEVQVQVVQEYVFFLFQPQAIQAQLLEVQQLLHQGLTPF